MPTELDELDIKCPGFGKVDLGSTMVRRDFQRCSLQRAHWTKGASKRKGQKDI